MVNLSFCDHNNIIIVIQSHRKWKFNGPWRLTGIYHHTWAVTMAKLKKLMLIVHAILTAKLTKIVHCCSKEQGIRAKISISSYHGTRNAIQIMCLLTVLG